MESVVTHEEHREHEQEWDAALVKADELRGEYSDIEVVACETCHIPKLQTRIDPSVSEFARHQAGGFQRSCKVCISKKSLEGRLQAKENATLGAARQADRQQPQSRPIRKISRPPAARQEQPTSQNGVVPAPAPSTPPVSSVQEEAVPYAPTTPPDIPVVAPPVVAPYPQNYVGPTVVGGLLISGGMLYPLRDRHPIVLPAGRRFLNWDRVVWIDTEQVGVVLVGIATSPTSQQQTRVTTERFTGPAADMIISTLASWTSEANPITERHIAQLRELVTLEQDRARQVQEVQNALQAEILDLKQQRDAAAQHARETEAAAQTLITDAAQRAETAVNAAKERVAAAEQRAAEAEEQLQGVRAFLGRTK